MRADIWRVAMPRRDQFTAVLDALRHGIREGAHRPGAPLIVGELASLLHVSATPVREALSRLAGEGLVEDRRGHGYFVHRLEAGQLQQALHLHLAYLASALVSKPLPGGGREEATKAIVSDALSSDDGVQMRAAAEALFTQIIRIPRNPLLNVRHRSLADRLAFVRRFEATVLEGVRAELLALASAVASNDLTAMRWAVDQYHARRIAAAADIVGAAMALEEEE